VYVEDPLYLSRYPYRLLDDLPRQCVPFAPNAPNSGPTHLVGIARQGGESRGESSGRSEAVTQWDEGSHETMDANAVVAERGYWWAGYAAERYWIEIRKVPGTGASLYCPLVDHAGHRSGWYELVDGVEVGDVVYHWHAIESKFVGRSVAAARATVADGVRVVPLKDFQPLLDDINLANIRGQAGVIESVRDQLSAKYPGKTLYLPFQFRSDGLRLMSNYFAKLPRELVLDFFGESGMADQPASAPDEGEAVDPSSPSDVTRSFLQPFKPKADSDYVALVKGGFQKRGRTHETLVNKFTAWLTTHGLIPGRNQAIDIGLADPAVVVEAKVVGSWPTAVRQAVGQLYEYRYFRVADPRAGLVFLASKPVPDEWVNYLERDRHIGVAWQEGDSFYLTHMARAAFGLP